MKRRVLLSAGIAGLGALTGCQGLLAEGERRGRFDVPDGTPTTRRESEGVAGNRTSDDGDDDPTSGDGSSLRIPPGLARTIDVGGRRRLVLAPGGVTSLLPDTSLVAGFAVSSGGPPRVWIGLGNEGPRRDYLLGRFPPFSGVRGVPTEGPDRDPALFLLPEAGREGSRSTPSGTTEPNSSGPSDIPDPAGSVSRDCWGASPSVGSISGQGDGTRFILWPGDALAGNYVLLRPPAASGCRPEPGNYRFVDGNLGVALQVAVFDRRVATPTMSTFDWSAPDLPAADRTVWFHETSGEVAGFFGPTRERVRPDPEAVIGGKLWNGTTGSLVAGAGDWRLYKFHGAAWRRVAPWRGIDAGSDATHYPGETRDLSVTVRRSPTRAGWNGDPGVVGGLGPGLYALSYGFGPRLQPTGPVHFGTGSPRRFGAGAAAAPWQAGTIVTFAALLRIEGDPVALTAVADPDSVTHDGSTSIVRIGAEAGTRRPALVVRRAADGEGDDVELITEQINQAPLLRTALATLRDDPDVVTVRVVTRTYSVGAAVRNFGRAPGRLGNLGTASGRFEFTYGGERFRAIVDEDP